MSSKIHIDYNFPIPGPSIHALSHLKATGKGCECPEMDMLMPALRRTIAHYGTARKDEPFCAVSERDYHGAAEILVKQLNACIMTI